MKKQRFSVTGMSCAACVSHVEKSVSSLGCKAEVSLLTNSMTVTFDENRIGANEIIGAVKKAGYGASLMGEGSRSERIGSPEADQTREMKKRFFLSLAFLIPLSYITMGRMLGLPQIPFLANAEGAGVYALLQFILLLPIVFLNRKFFVSGTVSAIHGAPNMDTLISLGAEISLIYGLFSTFLCLGRLGVGDLNGATDAIGMLSFESAGMILTLITLGKYLEAISRGKTGDAIGKLMDLTPKTAVIEENGEQKEIGVDRLGIGDIIVIKPGASVPADGEVVSGSSSVDESAITGESIPVYKEIGTRVSAGTVNQNGTLRVKVTALGEDSAIGRMIRLVEEASSGKAPISRLADKVASVFVPVVIGIAIVTFAVWLILGKGFDFALTMGVSVIVISCPCALGLATPVAVMAGTGVGATNGILYKTAESLEMMQKVVAVALDKTGTLTRGKPEITDIAPIGVTRGELISLALTLEKDSDHPLAGAVIRLAEKEGASPYETEKSVAVPGKGIRATLKGGEECFAGNEAFLSELGISVPSAGELTGKGRTLIFFAKGNICIGYMGATDSERKGAREAVDALKKKGVFAVILSGDNENAVKEIAGRLGVEKYRFGILPEDKEKEVKKLMEGGKLAMVGDGINDAPALASADVGIAIGAGTDIAMESADIVLTSSDPRSVYTALELSSKTVRTIKQNLFWAFFYNCLGIPLAAGVLFLPFGIRLNPMISAACMSISSIFVVTNALRLRRFRPTFKTESERLEADEEITVNEITEKEYVMKKEITVEGMMCTHCSGRVEKALSEIGGVKATVDLEKKTAFVETDGSVSDEVLKKAIEDAGYTVTGIK